MLAKDVVIVIMIMFVAFVFVSLYALVQIIREVNEIKLILNNHKVILNKCVDEISWIPFPETFLLIEDGIHALSDMERTRSRRMSWICFGMTN